MLYQEASSQFDRAHTELLDKTFAIQEGNNLFLAQLESERNALTGGISSCAVCKEVTDPTTGAKTHLENTLDNEMRGFAARLESGRERLEELWVEHDAAAQAANQALCELIGMSDIDGIEETVSPWLEDVKEALRREFESYGTELDESAKKTIFELEAIEKVWSAKQTRFYGA
jgi:hypothetical protein